jgi:hypothetical protein
MYYSTKKKDYNNTKKDHIQEMPYIIQFKIASSLFPTY